MSATSDDFFATGLTFYGTAVETVESFKEVAHARLVRAIDARTWKSLKLDRNWQEDLSKYQKQSQIYVSVSLGCRLGGEVCNLEMGLWWHRQENAGVEVYAGLHGDKDKKWRKSISPRRSGTKRFVGGTSYLLRTCTSADFAATADALLDELEEAAKAAQGAA